MRKTYICPNTVVVKLNTIHSLLTVSGGASGAMGISDTQKTTVWSREDNGWDIWGNDEE